MTSSLELPGPDAQLVYALMPTLVGLLLLLGAFGVYSIRNASRACFRDPEMDFRGLGGLTSVGSRRFFAWMMRPLWRGLILAKVPPNAITTLSVAVSTASGISIAAGRFALSGWLFLAAGALDFVDGRVARETSAATRGGALLDSVLDRYCEMAFLLGLSWYYRDGWVLIPALLASSGSALVPYVRARGEALGVEMKDVGFMQRPERVALMGAAAVVAPLPQLLLFADDPGPRYHVMIAALLLLAVTSHVTALQRLAHLFRALGGTPAPRSRESIKRLHKGALVSVLATVADYLVTRGLVEYHGRTAPMATAVGCVVGGFIAFALSRQWVYQGRNGSVAPQLARYVFVSGSSALLSSGGVAVVLLLPDVDYRIAWAAARAVVFLAWTFPMTSEFAFPVAETAAVPETTRRSMSRPTAISENAKVTT